MNPDLDKIYYVFKVRGEVDAGKAALRSKVRYVRSQDALAKFTVGAQGQFLTAFEALKIFGIDVLEEVEEYGSSIIVCNADEPAKTINDRMDQLGINQKQLVNVSGLTKKKVASAINSKARTSIKDLLAIAKYLSLDERYLSIKPGANAAMDLAYRLKEFKANKASPVNKDDIVKLSEAAWVIQAQHRFYSTLGTNLTKLNRFEKEPNYGSRNNPAFRIGYALATKAREIIGIEQGNAIHSLRDLCNNILGIPVILAELSPQIAGATISCAGFRGIVVNSLGLNGENPLVRRLTIAHELGHILWDPDQELRSLNIDTYETIENNYQRGTYIEQRANAFAVEFLAPQQFVRKILGENEYTTSKDSSKVIDYFGISVSAAKYHIKNSYYETIPIGDINQSNPIDKERWRIREDFTADYYPINETPISRRGFFSYLAILAQEEGFISDYTASDYLNTSVETFTTHKDNIKSFFKDTATLKTAGS